MRENGLGGTFSSAADKHVLEFKYRLYRPEHTSGVSSDNTNSVLIAMKCTAAPASAGGITWG
ncbi:MAG: hypothetical protein JSS66_08510 [Armatimonadetes bacterium]|nr:hypothetical protein [Armatimonadota bacterium]